ncbi:MAG: hypothetical protein V2A71_10695 [Candidatus Eisenbacteria bacterium]
MGITKTWILSPAATHELSMSVSRGIRWLMESDVRVHACSGFLSGGFRASAALEAEPSPPVYTEITGYATQFFLWLHEQTEERLHLDVALQSAEFLLRVQCGPEAPEFQGAFPFGLEGGTGEVVRQYFTFDSGVCASALIDAYRHTGERTYLSAALECGEWLLRVQWKDGSFPAVLSPLAPQEWTKPVEDWYGDRSAIHGKLATTLLKLWEESKDDSYWDGAVRLLAWLCRLQDTSGAFQASERVSDTVTHAHCYAVEGLLYAAKKVGDATFVSMSRKGRSWLLGAQNKDGSYHKFYTVRENLHEDENRLTVPFYRRLVRPLDTGATAQACRILLCGHSASEEELSAVERGVRFLLSMQSAGNELQPRGGFHARQDKLFLLKHAVDQFYPWTAMFAVQVMMAALRNPPRLDAKEIF